MSDTNEFLSAAARSSTQSGLMERNSRTIASKNRRCPCHDQKLDFAYTLSVGRVRKVTKGFLTFSINRKKNSKMRFISL